MLWTSWAARLLGLKFLPPTEFYFSPAVSRLSWYKKAARMGTPIVVAISAPTALAVRAADAAGITLVGVARRDGFEIFSNRDRD